jgi:hypothetical protein
MRHIDGWVAWVVWYALHGSPQNLQMVSSIAGGLIGLAWGFVVLRMALRKNYSGFRIALVPVAATSLIERNGSPTPRNRGTGGDRP